MTTGDLPIATDEVPIHYAPAITRNWRKFIACGCSHGELADPSALGAIVEFRDEYNPDKVIHLGDFIDTTAWRSGAAGTKDEVQSVSDDTCSGLAFLERLRPTLVFNGNHEIRIWRNAQKPNAIIKHAARATIEELREFITGEMHSDYVESYSLDESWRRMGNYVLGHGWFYNMHATKKHADKMGNCMFAHLHRLEVQRGDRSDRPVGVCVGYLGELDKFTYAEQWESRFRWQTGWVYGEYCDDEVVWHLHHHVTPSCKPKQFLPV